MEQDYAGKTVLVTGGNSGMGKATALLFARRGAQVAIAARRASELDDVVAEISDFGGAAIGIPTDIADPVQVSAMVEQVVARFGKLDMAFNNAGVMGSWGLIDELTPEDFDSTVNVNLRGTWLCARAEIAQMKRQGHGGAIVNTSSWLAHGVLQGSGLYSASKAAVDSLVRALALECADVGIRINNVNPGMIDTPMMRSGTNEETLKPFIDHTPMGRVGAAEEIAEAVVWLCSRGASFVTGQSLLVDGGYAIGGHRGFGEAASA